MKVYDLILAFFLSSALIFFLGANLNPDSISYINDDKILPPTYPLIINFFDYIFKSKGLNILAFFQVFFWICVSIYFSIFLCKILNFKDHYKYLFLFFFNNTLKSNSSIWKCYTNWIFQLCMLYWNFCKYV